MMRTHFGSDIFQPLFLHHLHHFGYSLCRAVAQMKSGTGLSGKQNISGCDHILHCIADSRQSQSDCILIIIHTALSSKINVFTMCKDRDIQISSNFHSFFAQKRIHNRFAILRKSRNSRLYHSLYIRKLLSFLSLCNSSGLKHMDTGQLGCFIMYIVYTVRSVDHRGSIWHSYHCSHSASGCCP